MFKINTYQKMNKHTKVSLIMAPFLLIGGYGLMDLYLDYSEEPRVMEFKVEGADCNISGNRCLLTAGDLEASIYLEDEMTVVNTTFPMYRVSLFIVDTQGASEEFQLGMTDSAYYWRAEMNLFKRLAEQPNGITMRIIAQQEKDSFLSEFTAR